MARIGAKDAFEQEYTECFRSIVKGRGVFVQYERDRAARDIGVHFTKPQPDGGQDVTTALAWFQLKGIMATTMSADEFRGKTSVSYRLYVEHLQFWYLQPAPTYLALYIESAGEPQKPPKMLAAILPPQQGSTRCGQFLILNLKKYVEERWGRSVFNIKKKRVTVEIPTTSVLDDHALDLIVRENDQDAWSRALGVEPLLARQCRRDYQLIWRLATASERNVEHRLQYRPWISKRRTTLDFEERTIGTTQWVSARSHWAPSFPWSDVEVAYPFIDFFTTTPPPDVGDEEDEDENQEEGEDEDKGEDEEEDEGDDKDEGEDEDQEDGEDEDEDGDEDEESLRLKNGDKAYGFDLAGEYEEFTIQVALNRLGRRLFQHVRELVRLGFVSVDLSRREFLSAAPWDDRSV